MQHKKNFDLSWQMLLYQYQQQVILYCLILYNII